MMFATRTDQSGVQRPGRRTAGLVLCALLLGTGLAALALIGGGCGRRAVPVTGDPGGGSARDLAAASLRLETEINAALVRLGIDPTSVIREEHREERQRKLRRGSVARWVEVQREVIAVPGGLGLSPSDYVTALKEAATRAGARAQVVADTPEGLVLALGTSIQDEDELVDITFFRLRVSAPVASASEGAPRAAIIIDDWGLPSESAEAMLELPMTLNMAVIPFLPASESLALAGLSKGWEVLVHLPMQPINSHLENGQEMVKVSMSDEEIAALVTRAFEAVPGADGTNNHMGSRATGDARVMRAVLREVRARGWFFVDSRTSPNSVAPEAAREAGLRYGINSLFLDGENGPDYGGRVAYVRSQLHALLELARRHGRVIGIGHVRPATVEALRLEATALAESGVQLVPVRDLVSWDYPLLSSGGRGKPSGQNSAPTDKPGISASKPFIPVPKPVIPVPKPAMPSSEPPLGAPEPPVTPERPEPPAGASETPGAPETAQEPASSVPAVPATIAPVPDAAPTSDN